MKGLKKILADYKKGKLEEREALKLIENYFFVKMGDVKVDVHRRKRHGFPEVIYGEGKSLKQIADSISKLGEISKNVLVTRVEKEIGLSLKKLFPDFTYDEVGMCFYRYTERKVKGKGQIVIVSAGASDRKVVQEAYITAKLMGNRVKKITDVGVAGIHRLFAHIEILKKAKVLIVIAGMEGALPSVVGGIVGKPVIAVPTSQGYGTGKGGFAALLSMLNSCAPNVAVVNIDNGFGAAYIASLINRA